MATLLTAILTLLLAFLTFVGNYVYARYRLMQQFKNLGIPGPKPHFFKGNTEDMRTGATLPIDNMSKWYKKYGKIFGYYKGNQPILVVGDLEGIKQILVKEFGNFANRIQPLLTSSKDSLLVLEGQRWKEVRKIVTPTFSASKLKQIIHLMNRSVADFGNELSKMAAVNEDIDIYDRFQRLTLDVIGETALAMQVKCQRVESNEFYENVRDVMRVGGSRFSAFIGYFPETAFLAFYLLRFRTVMKAATKALNNLKSVIKFRRNESSKKTVDILQLMLEASVDNSNGCKPLTDSEIVDNCWVFILAGFETTATSLAYAAYLLSRHQDVQEKVYKEIIQNVTKLENPTYEDANNLPYLNQVMNEVLRLYAPVPLFVHRTAAKEFELNGKMIPKGMNILIPVHCVHHDPDYWIEPEKFDPDRFSPENKVNILQMSHLPFGGGPRNCIGMRFAMLEIKLALIRLLTKNMLVPSDKQVEPPELFVPHVTHVPKNGLFVKVLPRLV